MKFLCPHCGEFSVLKADTIDNGLMIHCFKCGKAVVFEILKPEDRLSA